MRKLFCLPVEWDMDLGQALQDDFLKGAQTLEFYSRRDMTDTLPVGCQVVFGPFSTSFAVHDCKIESYAYYAVDDILLAMLSPLKLSAHKSGQYVLTQIDDLESSGWSITSPWAGFTQSDIGRWKQNLAEGKTSNLNEAI